MKITDKGMQARPEEADIWLTEAFGRGYGALLGRIAPSGARSFYYRYAGSKAQVRLPIGPYDPKGDGETTFSVAQARIRATEWSRLYHGDALTPGIKDLREHFEREEAEKQRAAKEARQAEEAHRKAVEEAERQAALERGRRLTVRQLFDRWAATELTPRLRTDGTRAGRKDGGQYTREQFERRLFPRWGDVPVQDVRKADLLAILDEVKAEGKLRTANVLLADMKQMLRFGVAREIVDRNVLDTEPPRESRRLLHLRMEPL